MHILVYTKFNSSNIEASLGKSEYSYYFVLHKFLPVLREIGQVQIVTDPIVEVDEYYEKALKDGHKCVFLCFTAPHNSFLGLKCPTVPVFAWEYDTIPNEEWDGNKMNNWVYVLKELGTAITHSNHSVKVIRSELGEDFPVMACPAPMDLPDVHSIRPNPEKGLHQQYEVSLTKEVIDSSRLQFAVLSSKKGMAQRIEITHVLLQTWAYEVLEDLLPKWLFASLRSTYLFLGKSTARSLRFFRSLKSKNKANAVALNLPDPVLKAGTQDSPDTTNISGVIYTSILNILDGRKNYEDMVAAFCHALNDKADATLILKTPVVGNLYFFKEKVYGFLRKLPEYKCRIVIIGYYLDSDSYSNLIKASTFYVNTSFGEGQCLPLMEYMAAGVPAIAPDATALGDYVNSSNSFVVKTCSAPTIWQHDERLAIRTVHHQPDWYSLVNAYKSSYEMAKNDQLAYQVMCKSASLTLKEHCSKEKAKEKLSHFLTQQERDFN